MLCHKVYRLTYIWQQCGVFSFGEYCNKTLQNTTQKSTIITTKLHYVKSTLCKQCINLVISN